MKEYKNDHLIVHWFPELCSHPGICLRLLPEVFNLKQRPWINVNAAEPEEIINTIDKCPSGAIRYSIPEGSKIKKNVSNGVGNINFENTNSSVVKIKVNANGPLLIEGPTIILDFEGKPLREGHKMALCRCGLSGNRPFCDGAHSKQSWKPDQTEK